MISGRTSVATLIGTPLAGAGSPAAVSARFDERSVDAVLVPLEVGEADAASVVDRLRSVGNWIGSIVTMPCKQAVVPSLTAPSAAVVACGACNVLWPDGDGLAGDMLDGAAMCDAIQSLVPGGLRGRRVGIVGAGSVAAAIAMAAAARGAGKLVIANRTASRARALAAAVRAAAPDAVEVGTAGVGTAGIGTAEDRSVAVLSACDVIVNATSVGMWPGDGLPVPQEVLASAAVVADVVVADRDTALVAAARASGAAVVTGRQMLDAQLDLLVDRLVAGIARRRS